MEPRRQAQAYLIFVALVGALSLYLWLMDDGMGSLGSMPWILSILTLIAFASGMDLLWRTGTYRDTVLAKFNYVAAGLAGVGFMLNFAGMPGRRELVLTAFLGFVLLYSIHFLRKPRKGLGDILRLLVVIVSVVAYTLGILGVWKMTWAYWTSIGLVVMAVIVYLRDDAE